MEKRVSVAVVIGAGYSGSQTVRPENTTVISSGTLAHASQHSGHKTEVVIVLAIL